LQFNENENENENKIMGTIKGQNLRVLVGNPSKCVAAATSCTVHLSLQLESETTKDSGDWDEQGPVGKNWDGSVDALVVDGIYFSTKAVATHEVPGSSRLSFYSPQLIKLPAGMTINATSQNYIELFDTNISPLAEPVAEVLTYTNNTNAEIGVYLGSDVQDAEINAYITDGDRTTANELLNAYFSGNKVKIRFSLTGGRNNIVESDALLEGMAYINDMQLTAQARQNAQMTMSFTGDGELGRVDN
jgi:hypothetical protein